MFKKIITTLSFIPLFFGLNNAYAQPGPYAGISFGGNLGSWDVRDNTTEHFSFSTRGINGTLFGGFAFNPHPFYVAAEAFFNQASNRSATKTINLGLSSRYIRQSYSYGASLLPGISIVDGATVYVRGGVVRTRFQIKDTTLSTNVNTNNNVNLTGAQAGLGFLAAVSGSVDVRVEYIYTMYNSYTNSFGRFTPVNHQANLGIAYRLG